jgi:hypothetical protein
MSIHFSELIAQLKEMCSNLKETMDLMNLRYGNTNPDFSLLHKKASELATTVSSDKMVLAVAKPQKAAAPLQRPKVPTGRGKRKEDFNDHSNSNSSEDEKKGKGRRQRAKAAPSEELYCRSCGETQTCEWRRGPDGYKSYVRSSVIG